MNPFQAIMGSMNPGGGNGGPAGMNGGGFGGPIDMLQNAIQQAKQLAGSFQNPQQLVSRYFPDAPAEVCRDPEQLVGWLQQTGRVSPQMVQTARQMMGGR